MHRRKSLFALALTICGPLPPAVGQAAGGPSANPAPSAATAATPIPALVPYSGFVVNRDGKPQPGETGITFLIFKDATGGEPLWTETQTVPCDTNGHYEVYLGATSSSGLPLDLFHTGEARWLEVQVAGQTPQPRVLLASVPYAIKAADAVTLGGLPASAYALAGPDRATAATAPPAVSPDVTSSTVTTPGGTSGYLPVYSGATTIDDSLLFQSGASIGIDTKTPAATLDVNGSIAARGAVTMEAAGTASASAGQVSQPIDFFASAYNSSTKQAVAPQFTLRAEPAGNNTSAPSGSLNLLYGNGAAPSETGLAIGATGIIKFAPGQTFPGTATGAITGVTAGTGLTGGGTSGTVKLSLDTTKIPTLTSSPTFNGSAGDGVVGDTAGTILNTAGVEGIAGRGNTSGFSGIAGVWGNASAHVGVLGTSDQYAGVEGISESGQGVYGTSVTGFGVQATSTSGVGVQGTSTYGPGAAGSSTTGAGVVGYTAGNTLGTAGTFGIAGARTSFNGIAGIWGDAAAHVGVFGSSNQYAGVFGASTQGQGVQGQSTSNSGVQGTSASGTGVLGYTAGSTIGTGGVVGQAGGTSGFSSIAGVWGDASTHIGVYGSSSQAQGVLGVSTHGSGVYGLSSDTTATDDVAGVYGIASGALPAVKGNNVGAGPAAVFISTSPDVATLTAYNNGLSSGTATAVLGIGSSEGGIGVEGETIGGIAVLGVTGLSAPGNRLSGYAGNVAVFGDATLLNGVAVIGSASNDNAGYFSNNSSTASTIYARNYGSGNTGEDVTLFGALEAAMPNGTCGVGGNGDLTCTGQVKTLATTGSGARTVETYSMQSPENWMEDFGSGTLQHGLAIVTIDAAFAETVSGSADYHVFLTPRGDSKGLYVTNTTAASFEVHESGGGTSTVGFDYRIVAKRRGLEAQRMVDVTEAMNALKARNELQAAKFKRAAK